jgi:hypothetical protein
LIITTTSSNTNLSHSPLDHCTQHRASELVQAERVVVRGPRSRTYSARGVASYCVDVTLCTRSSARGFDDLRAHVGSRWVPLPSPRLCTLCPHSSLRTPHGTPMNTQAAAGRWWWERRSRGGGSVGVEGYRCCLGAYTCHHAVGRWAGADVQAWSGHPGQSTRPGQRRFNC